MREDKTDQGPTGPADVGWNPRSFPRTVSMERQIMNLENNRQLFHHQEGRFAAQAPKLRWKAEDSDGN